MSATRTVFGRVGGVCAFFLVIVCAASAAGAPEVLFPAPLHITRELSSPFSTGKTVIDEYCHGNRVVSISGRRTAIVDHSRRELTVIDFAAGTFSVTSFETIAGVNESTAPASLAADAARDEWRVEQRGGRVVASRPGQLIEAERQNGAVRETIRLTVDDQLTVSRAAAEALLGTAYPNRRNETSDVVLGALQSKSQRRVASNAAPAARADEFFLPLEYNVAYQIEGETIESRNVVVRIGNELPPPDLLAIPPGATRVDSDAVLSRRLLNELDHPSGRKR